LSGYDIVVESKGKRTGLQSNLGDWQGLCTSVEQGCVSCGLCRKECRYLQTFGLPIEQATEALAERLNFRQLFSCSLCGLCTAVCPQDIDPAAMFASLRREAVSRNLGTFKEHNPLTGYEKWGGSGTFSWYGLPQGCETIFFPGCALPGTRPQRVLQVVEVLRRDIPTLGVVLDCCTKPSHDLGKIDYFSRSFDQLRKALLQSGVRNVLVACPNCFRMFDQYGDGLQVQTIYEVLADHDFGSGDLHDEVTIHDPCGVRDQPRVHEAVRKLLSCTGLSIIEMKHQGTKTVCCGEGGAVGYLNKEFAVNWTNIRAEEAAGKRIITYCAGCTHFLGRLTPTSHILDLLFEGEKTLQGTVRVARSPFTWINRLLLKQKLRKKIAPATSGHRVSTGAVKLQSLLNLQTAENPLNLRRQRKAKKMYNRYRMNFPDIREIEAKLALRLQVNGEAILIDVRSLDEQKISMLPGAITEADFMENPLKFTEQTVICYCTIGYRSGLFVKQHGQRFPQLRNLSGGLLLWLHAGGILEKDGKKSSQVHVYGSKWALQPVGYLPVF